MILQHFIQTTALTLQTKTEKKQTGLNSIHNIYLKCSVLKSVDGIASQVTKACFSLNETFFCFEDKILIKSQWECKQFSDRGLPY